MDYEAFVPKRIASLRVAKGNVSARDVSLNIGQNENYINQIENHKAEPSMSGFFYICEYFGITPHEFFDTENPYPAQLKAFIEDLKQLDENELLHLSEFVKHVVSNRK